MKSIPAWAQLSIIALAAAEMALHVLAYNLTRVINIMGPGRLIAAMRT